MKKSILTLLLIPFILIGCTKQNKGTEQNQVSSSADNKTEFVSEAKVEVKKMIPGVMLWDEATFWTEKDDHKMYWKLTVDYATSFECYPSLSDDSSLVESKKSIRVISSTKEEAEKEFTKIKYQNTDYWVQTSIIAINAVPAMILKDNTFIYNKPDIEKITSEKLPVGTIIALSKDEPINGFNKISARIGEKLYDEVYIKVDKVSENMADIKALSLIEKINNSDDKAIQLELLENVKTLNVSPEVNDIISDLENTLVNGNSFNDFDYNFDEELQNVNEIKTDVIQKTNEISENIIKTTEDFSEKLENEAKEIQNKIEEKSENIEEKTKEIINVIKDNKILNDIAK